jgi:CheY-like chemotaxis protein
LGVTPPSVVNWINGGLLVAHRTPGGHRRIAKEDIVSFAREHDYPVPGDFTPPPARSTRPRVLVVDDHHEFLTMVRDFLELRQRFEVEIADSGFAAGLIVARFKPDVILMDIDMEVMDGFEVLRRLQADPETRSIPVIACTGYRDPHIQERVRREAFVGYLEKPVRLERLASEIESAVSGRVLQEA